MFLFPLLAFAIGFVVARSSAPENAHAVSGRFGAPMRATRVLPARAPYIPAYASERRLEPEYHHEHERELGYRGPRSFIERDMAPGGCPPSPMAVLSEMIARGQFPPSFVAQCAAAEAELIGRYDVAHRITQTYVIPALQGGTAVPASPDAPAQDPGSIPVAPTDPSAMPGDAADAAPDPAQEAAPAPQDQPSPEVPSPISGVTDGEWSHLLGCLVRESPAFVTGKHMGRYRHHRNRLSEIGFDDQIIGADPGLQDLAMSTDLADCFAHLHQSGSLDELVGRAISMPNAPGEVACTLSGLLGVCSVAGLEGAINWCERPTDREKYPHTTMAFIRTNGAF